VSVGKFHNFFSVLALFFISFSQSAVAQLPSNSLPSGDQKTYTKISAAETISMLVGIGVQAQTVQTSPTSTPNVLAQAPSGGRVYVDFVSCEDKVALTGCNSIILRAAMSNAGVTYDDLNRFNSNAVVIKGVNIAERNLVFFMRHMIVFGGVRNQQLQVQTALFLNDMDIYVTNQANSTSVSYEDEDVLPNASSKITGLNTERKIQQPHSAAAFVDDALVDSAIYNTYSVRFMTAEARRLLQIEE